MSEINKWYTRKINLVLAFTQSPVGFKVHIDIPKGFNIKDGNTKDYALKLHRNIYGQNQAWQVWNTYLTYILLNKVCFKKSNVD